MGKEGRPLMRRVYSWAYVNLLPRLLVSGIGVVVMLVIGETYIRLTHPILDVNWPSRFDPAFGFNFEPNTEVRWSNLLDFGVAERTNSLGFLDREPGRRSDRCHVALIGDSFIEAAQVRNEHKVQVNLEKLAAAERPDLNLTAAGFGWSGTGQLNQLPFYDVFAHPQQPHLVVLVFVGNDFRNNSAVLETIVNGWDPDHAPRMFAKKIGGRYVLTEIDPNWRNHVLPVRTVSLTTVGDRLSKISALFDWGYRKTKINFPGLFADSTALEQTYKARYELLLKREPYRQSLLGWDYLNEDNPTGLDTRFNERDLSPPFLDAVEYTKFALEEFKQRVARDHGHLVILASGQLSLSGRPDDPEYRTRQLNRLRAIAEEVGVPVINQYDYILAQGEDPLLAQFAHDGHWSIKGYQWAAEAIWAYIQHQDKVCR